MLNQWLWIKVSEKFRSSGNKLKLTKIKYRNRYAIYIVMSAMFTRESHVTTHGLVQTCSLKDHPIPPPNPHGYSQALVILCPLHPPCAPRSPLMLPVVPTILYHIVSYAILVPQVCPLPFITL